MPQIGERAKLALEEQERIPIERAQRLQRDGLPQRRVPRLVDDAHPAAADDATEAIAIPQGERDSLASFGVRLARQPFLRTTRAKGRSPLDSTHASDTIRSIAASASSVASPSGLASGTCAFTSAR